MILLFFAKSEIFSIQIISMWNIIHKELIRQKTAFVLCFATWVSQIKSTKDSKHQRNSIKNRCWAQIYSPWMSFGFHVFLLSLHCRVLEQKTEIFRGVLNEKQSCGNFILRWNGVEMKNKCNLGKLVNWKLCLRRKLYVLSSCLPSYIYEGKWQCICEATTRIELHILNWICYDIDTAYGIFIVMLKEIMWMSQSVINILIEFYPPLNPLNCMKRGFSMLSLGKWWKIEIGMARWRRHSPSLPLRINEIPHQICLVDNFA